ncbi:uncharacterized protein Bfra_001366 [Botrytis fragariae]|uniref:Uncharacterized protein n=1 Tax=Botrytis fragariae TaxID=1964551 RepID=A0A8H6ELV2_9HELO|nr:uncharacterized protein Bfra_001366 [Botrytis fragariae]KAF5877007.1 hypothetical protein Bfra_001366 [Botrytis fragariae]
MSTTLFTSSDLLHHYTNLDLSGRKEPCLSIAEYVSEEEFTLSSGSTRSLIMPLTSHIHSLAVRQTRRTVIEILRANRTPFNKCTCRHNVQSRFNSKDYAAGLNDKPRQHVTRADFLDLENMQLLIYKVSCEWLERIVPHSSQSKADSFSQHGIKLIPFSIPDYQKVSVYLKKS